VRLSLCHSVCCKSLLYLLFFFGLQDRFAPLWHSLLTTKNADGR
jgi:hypothetical protein